MQDEKKDEFVKFDMGNTTAHLKPLPQMEDSNDNADDFIYGAHKTLTAESAKQTSIAFAEWMKREGWEVCDTPPPTVQDDHLCVKWEYPDDYVDGDTVEGTNEQIDILFDKFILQYNPK